MKKILIILAMLLMQNVFAKPFPTLCNKKNCSITAETISKEDINLLKRYNSLNAEHKNAMNILLDLLYKQEKEKKLRKK